MVSDADWTLDRHVRVVLTPLPAPARRPHEPRRVDERWGGDPRAKEPPPPGAARALLELTTNTAGPAGTATGVDGDVDMDSDSSDPDGSALEGSSQLSAYERKRLKNIKENANFFASLKLHESAARLRKIASKVQSHGIKRVRPKKAEDETVRRRSMRLQRVDPSGIPLPELPAQPETVVDEHPLLPPGPLQMVPADVNTSKVSTKEFLDSWAKISEIKPEDTEKHVYDIKRYEDSLSCMILSEDAVTKVVKNRICSMAIHPSESRTLVAAGDRSGQIGLWDLVNALALLVYRSEDAQMSSFDFLQDNASTLVVGHWDGDVAVVDRRTPGTSAELSASLNSKATRTVHVHPVNRQYFVAAGSVNVCIYDVRSLKHAGDKPVCRLNGHTKSVASAYFSPVTGNRVVTTCSDDKLRVYDTSCLSSTVLPFATVRHNNNTGRWLTRFRAIWDPKQEDCFVVGSMARPRQIEVYQATGKLLHSFYNIDYLGSVCSINVLHPTQNILVGGNSSGRLHVFKD
ncbi:PREDICTED: WD repeat-containing protein 76 [Crocodylus porosus]|uniref:WD repeat-containing protein 76 n=1 Tax=Crocodylus porosus TaxID=8502 RepID=UPI00093F29EA|nr:PREDICTED: WD repeat-containing protein 76 [Crocodylus porosus]